MNIAYLQTENLKIFGEYVSVVFDGETEYTNLQLKQISDKMASVLLKTGAKRGDHIAVLLPNSPEVLASYSAILKIGAVITPLMFLIQPEELLRIVRQGDISYIITSKDLVWKIKEIEDKIDKLNVLLVDNGVVSSLSSKINYWSFPEISKNVEPFEGFVDVKDSDDAILLFTSGTTGDPKGVILSHRNLHFNIEVLKIMLEESGRLDEIYKGETALAALPLAHMYGIFLMFSGFIGKGRAVLLKWFDTKKIFENIQRWKVVAMAGVPTMLAMLLYDPDKNKYDLSSMKYWGCAAAPLSEELRQKFESTFPGQILQGYGLTETAPMVSVERTNRPRKPGSVGIPIPKIEVKIIDDKGQALPPGEIGEICVKGENVMKGYYKMPDETRKAIVEGFLHTGDLGYLDNDGYLFVVDRKKDLIIRGGFNIIPSDVENIFMKHPDIVECAVVGVSDEIYGEELKAFCVKRFGSQLTEEELRNYVKKYLAAHKVPKFVEFRDVLPKNPMGKILKRVLREEEGKKQ